jgi:hypothetical protein
MMKNTILGCAISLLILMAIAGCSPIPLIKTPTICPYVGNPGPPPPEVEQKAGEGFISMGLTGNIKVEAYGEYSCDHFSVEEINFDYTIYVRDLRDQAALNALVIKVKESAAGSLQGWNLGKINIHFLAGEECWWDELQGACVPIRHLVHP